MASTHATAEAKQQTPYTENYTRANIYTQTHTHIYKYIYIYICIYIYIYTQTHTQTGENGLSKESLENAAWCMALLKGSRGSRFRV